MFDTKKTGKTILEDAAVAGERDLQMERVMESESDYSDAVSSGTSPANRIPNRWVAYASDLDIEVAKPFSMECSGKDDMVKEIVMSFLP